MNYYCLYCHAPCGRLEFCDAACRDEHRTELNALEREVAEDLPGESRHADLWEPEEWDVAGGL